MSVMNDHDSIRAYSDGLKRAVSACRQMASLKKSRKWLSLANQIEAMRLNGVKIYHSRRMRRLALLEMADQMVKGLGGESALEAAR